MRFRILVLALGTFAIGTDGLVIAGILPAMAHDLRISVDTAGLLVTGFAWIYALGSPVLAAVTGRVPRKQLLLSGLVVFLSANILAALATNFWLLLAARVLAALGAALYTPVASTVASAMVPPEMRGRALAIVLAGMTVATVMGVPLGIIVAAQFGWQMTFWVVAALSIIAFIGVLALLPAVANPPAVGLKTRLAMLRNPVLVLMLLNATMWLIANFIVYTYLAELLERVTHLADSAISGMIFLFGLASVLGNALGGYGADRWGATRMLVIGMIGLAIAFLVLPWASVTVWGVAIVLVVWGIFGWMLMTPQQHRLIALSPQSANIVLSLNGSALYIGSGTGAIVGGLTLRFFSVQALGWVGGTITLLALVVLFICLRATSVARLTEQQAEILREEAVA